MKKDFKVLLSFSLIKLNHAVLGSAAAKPKHLTIYEKEKDNWIPRMTTNPEVATMKGIEFKESLSIVFIFEKKQFLRADLMDSENGSLVGSSRFELGEVIGAKKNFALKQVISPSGQEVASIVLNYAKDGPRRKTTYMTYENKEKEFQKLASLSENIEYDFLDYIQGGLEMALLIGIDFTGSNGVPTRPESLHSINKNGQMNLYEKAITDVGEVLLDYDKDKLVPVYGFGAKPKFPGLTSNLTCHCFPCSGNPSNSEAYTIDGVLNMYKNALTQVELSGPTFFAPLLNEVRSVVSECAESGADVYTIVLIITDGVLHDMQDSIDIIVELSYLPCSIIICGVGNEDFSLMVLLDSDDELLKSSKGKQALRDIVQFVPFNEFKDQETLSACVLEEIPHQVSSYYSFINKKPNPVVKPSEKDFEEEYVSKVSIRPGYGPQRGVPGGGYFSPGSIQMNSGYPKQQFPQYFPNPNGFVPQGQSTGGFNYPSMAPPGPNGSFFMSPSQENRNSFAQGHNPSFMGQDAQYSGVFGHGAGAGNSLNFPGGSPSGLNESINMSRPIAEPPKKVLCESEGTFDDPPPVSNSRINESLVIASKKVFVKPSSISNLSLVNSSPQKQSQSLKSIPNNKVNGFPKK